MPKLIHIAAALYLLTLPSCLLISSNKTTTAPPPASPPRHASSALPSPSPTATAQVTVINQSQGWIRSELFFGLSRPTGPLISDAEFQHFADTVISPRFPTGYTILHATGYWQGQSAPQNEPSKVVVILHPPSPDASLKITDICKTYAQTFNQEAVLRSSLPAEVEFISK